MRTPKTSRSRGSLAVKPLMDELVLLRGVFRELVAAYSADVEAKLGEVLAKASTLGDGGAAGKTRAAEIRDMLIVLRSLDVKPAKGRRRDLKKIEAAVDDLCDLSEKWETA